MIEGSSAALVAHELLLQVKERVYPGFVIARDRPLIDMTFVYHVSLATGFYACRI